MESGGWRWRLRLWNVAREGIYLSRYVVIPDSNSGSERKEEEAGGEDDNENDASERRRWRRFEKSPAPFRAADLPRVLLERFAFARKPNRVFARLARACSLANKTAVCHQCNSFINEACVLLSRSRARISF